MVSRLYRKLTRGKYEREGEGRKEACVPDPLPDSHLPTHLLSTIPLCFHQLGGNETLEEEVTRYAGYFAMPNYQKVLDGRPLVYLFPAFGTNVTGDLQALTQASLAKTNKEPYYVVMGGGGDSARNLYSHALSIGAHAVSRYVTAVNDNTPGQPASYVDGIANNEIAFWAEAAATGAKLIPPISAGWDPRPRQ